MARIEGSVVINRPVGEVFAYMLEIGNWLQWNSGMVEAEQTSAGPMGVGSTFRGLNEFLGQRMEWTSEITEYEPERKMRQRIISGPMTIEQSLTFEHVEDGTKLTLAGEGQTGGFFKLAEAVVKRRMKKQMEDNLASLKGILEGGA